MHVERLFAGHFEDRVFWRKKSGQNVSLLVDRQRAAALLKVAQGLTSLEEANRITVD